MVNELVEILTESGMPGELIEYYKVQGDGVWAAFIAADMGVKLLIAQGRLPEERHLEITLEFAKIITMKVNLAPQGAQLFTPQGPAGKVIDLTNLPGGFHS